MAHKRLIAMQLGTDSLGVNISDSILVALSFAFSFAVSIPKEGSKAKRDVCGRQCSWMRPCTLCRHKQSGKVPEASQSQQVADANRNCQNCHEGVASCSARNQKTPTLDGFRT